MKNSLYPCLWFDNNAFDAASFYCSVFPDSKITINTPMVVNFELNGNKFMGLNGGPKFKFNEAVSFVINCETQTEIDHYWSHLSDGGEESNCGWVKDRFGMWWQVVPTVLGQLMSDPEKSQRVTEAFMRMKKFDIEELVRAYDGT